MANKIAIFVGLIVFMIEQSYAFDKLSPEIRSKISPSLQGKVLQSQEKAKEMANDTTYKQSKTLGDVEGAKGKTEGVNNISPDSLESEGLRVRNEAYKDKDSDLHQASKLWNAEKRKQYPADDPIFDKFDSVTKNIESILGKDCKEVKGKASNSGYIVKQKRRKAQEDLLEKNICEHLRNSFSCVNDVTTTCVNVGEKDISITNVSASGSPAINASFNSSSGHLTIGANHRTHQGTHWEPGDRVGGSEFSYRVEFNLERADAVSTFRLLNANFGSIILIKLNGHAVYASPYGGNELSLTGNYNEHRKPKNGRWHGMGNKRYWYWYVRTVNLGTHHAEVIENGWHVTAPNAEFKSYLVNGKNFMDIKIVVTGYGGLYLDFLARAKHCKQWSSEWRETCIQD